MVMRRIWGSETQALFFVKLPLEQLTQHTNFKNFAKNRACVLLPHMRRITIRDPTIFEKFAKNRAYVWLHYMFSYTIRDLI